MAVVVLFKTVLMPRTQRLLEAFEEKPHLRSVSVAPGRWVSEAELRKFLLSAHERTIKEILEFEDLAYNGLRFLMGQPA